MFYFLYSSGCTSRPTKTGNKKPANYFQKKAVSTRGKEKGQYWIERCSDISVLNEFSCRQDEIQIKEGVTNFTNGNDERVKMANFCIKYLDKLGMSKSYFMAPTINNISLHH